MRQQARLGMAMFLLSEAVFFLMLIAAFVYFRDANLSAAGGNLNLRATSIYTVFLLASSFTMWRATADRRRFWIAATAVLGAVFLAGQAREYWQLFQRNVTIGQGQFGSTFFTLTGLHGLHVLLGILLLSVVWRWHTQRAAIEAVGLYWQFVDGVWIVIFSIVYLWTFF
ncbi:MAG: heme-copper oxidase subunit III [Terriglobia bacterium]|nr:MAG: heme-copper oxidase subunit III [Terriglobia bacterium]